MFRYESFREEIFDRTIKFSRHFAENVATRRPGHVIPMMAVAGILESQSSFPNDGRTVHYGPHDDRKGIRVVVSVCSTGPSVVTATMDRDAIRRVPDLVLLTRS